MGLDPAVIRMPGTSTYIEVENFKSYKGFVRIGPLRPFMAVIGSNGSGECLIVYKTKLFTWKKGFWVRERDILGMKFGIFG